MKKIETMLFGGVPLLATLAGFAMSLNYTPSERIRGSPEVEIRYSSNRTGPTVGIDRDGDGNLDFQRRPLFRLMYGQLTPEHPSWDSQMQEDYRKKFDELK